MVLVYEMEVLQHEPKAEGRRVETGIERVLLMPVGARQEKRIERREENKGGSNGGE